MNAAETLDRPHAGLLAWLVKHHIDYDVHEHAQAFTAESTARAEGVDPATFAKVVGVVVDGGRRALLVLDAPDFVDLVKARGVLGAQDLRLMTEAELEELAPDCETGAMPAVGALFGVDMYADHAVRSDAAISFNAGTHRFTVRVDRVAWERATNVRYANLALGDGRPAWAVS